MKVLLVVLLFLAALGATLFAMGVFRSEPAPVTPAPQEPPAAPDATPKDGALAGAPSAEPETEPPPEIPTLDRGLRILLIGPYPDKVNVTWTDDWKSKELIHFRTHWQTPKPGDPAPPHKGLEPLTDAPGPQALDDVDVVVLYMTDPTKIPAAFFDRLAEKVRDRSVGLLVYPREVGGGILDQPAMSTLLPVESAKPLQGTPLPGVSTEEVPFHVTAAGTEHPATRIVPYKGWSERIWALHRTGEVRWGTKFVYPVERVKPGAVVLLEVDLPRQGRIPAVIQGDPAQGRVLWVGVPDFGNRVWYDATMHRKATALQLQWFLWLAGRTP